MVRFVVSQCEAGSTPAAAEAALGVKTTSHEYAFDAVAVNVVLSVAAFGSVLDTSIPVRETDVPVQSSLPSYKVKATVPPQVPAPVTLTNASSFRHPLLRGRDPHSQVPSVPSEKSKIVAVSDVDERVSAMNVLKHLPAAASLPR